MKPKIRIKKYGNRRLYDMEHKGYITLEELETLIQEGHEVEVVDSRTGEDLTQIVLTQLILENQKGGTTYLFSSEVLHQLIQYRDQSVSEFFQDYLPNILRSYMDWQHQAQSQFLHWAKLGWSASQYSRDLFMPGRNMWSMGQRSSMSPPPEETPVENQEQAEEIDTLKRKIEALEKRLNKPRKRG